MKKLSILIILASALCGCKEFLEPQSQSEYSPERAEQLTELVLSALPDPTRTGVRNISGGYLDLLTDDVKTRATIHVVDPLLDNWYAQSYVTQVRTLYTWQPDYARTGAHSPEYSGWEGIYADTYKKLTYVNSILDYVPLVEGTAAQKDYLRAQALALRAFYYLNLVNIYGEPYGEGAGGMGVPIRTTGQKENRPIARNTVGEVYALILSDLKEAIALFERLPAMDRNRRYRPTLPMSMLLLARAYLYMENWEQAEFYARRLVNEWSGFKVGNLKDLVDAGYTNLTKNEPLKQLFWPDFVSYDNGDVIWVYGSAFEIAGVSAQEMSQPLDKSKVLKNGVYATLTLASDDLIGSFHEDDLRLRTYFVRSLFDEPEYAAGSTVADGERFTYRAYGKLAINQSAEGTPDNTYRFLPVVESTRFGYTLRIAEAWLILAEALAEQGESGPALQALAEVQGKRFAGAVPASYTSGDVVECVRAERRRELCFEQLRWFDLRRWGMPRIEHIWYDTTIGSQSGSAQKYVLEQGDPGYTLPMPQKVLERNLNLTQVPLAPGRRPQ